jgi:hypothetical protein
MSLPFSKYQEASIPVFWNTKTFPYLQCNNRAVNNLVCHSHENFQSRVDWEVRIYVVVLLCRLFLCRLSLLFLRVLLQLSSATGCWGGNMAGVTPCKVHPSRSLFMSVNQSQLTAKLKCFYSLKHFRTKMALRHIVLRTFSGAKSWIVPW